MSSDYANTIPATNLDQQNLVNLEKNFGLKARLSQAIINDYECSTSRNYHPTDAYTKKHTHLLNKISIENLKDHINFMHYKPLVDEVKNKKYNRRNVSAEEIRYKAHFVYDPYNTLEKNKDTKNKISNLIRQVSMAENIYRLHNDYIMANRMKRFCREIKYYNNKKYTYERIIRNVSEDLSKQAEELVLQYNEQEQNEPINNIIFVNGGVGIVARVGQLGNVDHVDQVEYDDHDIHPRYVENTEDSETDLSSEDDEDDDRPRRVRESPKRENPRPAIRQPMYPVVPDLPIHNDIPEVNEEEIDEEEALKIYWNVMNKVAWKNKDEGKCDLSTVQKVFRNLSQMQKATIEAVYVILFKNVHTAMQNIMHNFHYDESTIFNIIGHICAVQNWYREVIISPDLALFVVDGELWQNFHNCMIELFPNINADVKEAI